jgi:hypothetical protein
VLHGVIRDHVDDFLGAAADRADGASLPEFIAREFRKFLTCVNDRARLEQLCRYVLRPPLAEDRLRRLADGRVRLGLKRP